MRRKIFWISVVAFSVFVWARGSWQNSDGLLSADVENDSRIADQVIHPEMNAALKAIREEGMANSRVMEIAERLTDQFGPRLTGSPSLERAGDWALGYLSDRGVSRAGKEGWDFGHPGWENEHLDIHVTSPVLEPLVAEVLAWTPSTDGTVRADIMHLVPPVNVSANELDDYLEPFKKKVLSKIVFVGDETIKAFSEDEPEAASTREPGKLTQRQVDQHVMDFLLEYGAAVQVNSSGMPDGLIRAFGNRTFDVNQAIPTVILRAEDYGRLLRLHRRGLPVQLEIVIENQSYPRGETAYNYLAEIEGSSREQEVVMLGGHLDSWHAATGATDNAAGSAIMIEAMRILLDLDLQPKRSIRMALWSGEEQGLLGSKAYVKRHFGTDENPGRQHDAFGGYVNVDTGTGRLQSAIVFGPESTADMLSDILHPLADLGISHAEATNSRVIGGSDHTTFNAAGLPGISMVQDPVRYRTHTWHTNIDTFEQLLPDHLKQAAIVVASTVYQLAMEDDMLPRFDSSSMPAAEDRW
jgi:hypothetical protein